MQLGLQITNLEQWFPKVNCKRITWEALNPDSQALIPEILIQKVQVKPENLFFLCLKTSGLENNTLTIFLMYSLKVNITSIDHNIGVCPIYKSLTYIQPYS